MEFNIAVIRGDGAGSDITNAAIGCLDAISAKYSHKFNYSFPLLGGSAIDATGVPLPSETTAACLKSHAVLCGGIGGEQFNNLAFHLKPEKALLNLKAALGLYASCVPIVTYDGIKTASPLKSDIIKQGIDCVIIREISGGIYNGNKGYRDGSYGQEAFDTEVYSIMEIERVAKLAFDIALNRRKKVTSIDKSNYLETGRLWRATVSKVAKSYKDVEVEHLLVDEINSLMLTNPSKLDVLLAPNMFGEILTAQAAAITGAANVIPSSSLGTSKIGFYEAACQNICPDPTLANPIGTILAAAMMLSTSLGLQKETYCLENAVKTVLGKGYHTLEINITNNKKVDCTKMGELIALEVFNS